LTQSLGGRRLKKKKNRYITEKKTKTDHRVASKFLLGGRIWRQKEKRIQDTVGFKKAGG